MSQKNPRELLSRVIDLINKDLDHIEERVSSGKLDHDSSQDLARYSTALLRIVDDLDSQADTAKRSLHKMSDKDLLEMAESVVNEMRNK